MKINLSKIFFSLILFFGLTQPGFCTELPESVVKFIKQKFPEAGIRFDGLVELPDKTEYLPVLPLVYEERENPAKIIKTIPFETDFAQKPDLILFNNNLALLKIIKKQGEPPTLISGSEVPLKVKLGLLPQDLVVPRGLVLSPDLKVILGDLKIPLKQKIDAIGEVSFYSNEIPDNGKKNKIIGKTTEYKYKLPEMDFLNKKKLYASNHRDNKLNVLDSQTGRLKKTITLPSVPFDMALTRDGRYLLMAGSTIDKIFVIDTRNDKFVKTVDVGKYPSSIICPRGLKKIYVANRLSSSISEIDSVNMQVIREIPVAGHPDNLSSSENKDFIFYNDHRSGKIYELNIKTAQTKNLFQDRNVSKIAQFNRYVFSLSRSDNTLTVFDLKKGAIIKKTKTGKKPVDFVILDKLGKIFVLSADSDELNIIDMENFDVIKTVALESSGFPGKITLIENQGKAVITNYDSYELSIYNIDTEKIQGHIPVNFTVGSMLINDK